MSDKQTQPEKPTEEKKEQPKPQPRRIPPNRLGGIRLA